MPIYEFTCKSCKNIFSKRVKIAEKDQIECTKCSSKDLKENYTTEIKTSARKNADSACSFLFNKRLSGG